MNYLIRLYRNRGINTDNMPPLNFNATTLEEALRKMERAKSTAGAFKVELLVELTTWNKNGN